MDPRLQNLKSIPRAMRAYILMLYEFVREIKPNKMLEIGVQAGQSTKTILCAMGMNKKGLLVSIDHKSRQHILDVEYEDLKPYWLFIRGNSHNPVTLDAVRQVLDNDEYYDMLFIDGDHTAEGARQDFKDYSELVKPGGVVMFHDTSNYRAGVSEVWAEITWEKFNCDWGTAHMSVVPGFGICRKPK